MVLYVFLPVLMLRKCQKRKENLEFLIFLGNHILGEVHEEQSIIFWGRTLEKSTCSFEKIMKRKLENFCF